MPQRVDVIRSAETLVDNGRFVQDLGALVSRPTESQDPERSDQMLSYLEDLLVPRFETAGFECTIHANPMGNPFLVARRIEDASLPTILGYGHGDVTRGQEGDWGKDRKPFELRTEGDRLYGRGTADNKGQHLINLMALEAVIAARGRLGFNSTWLIEMGEETGSPGLIEFCEVNKELLNADVLIASDGPRMSTDIPLVFLGARGAINFGLSVDLREGAHHSGNWGGLLSDPAIILAQALATITDKRGQLQIPEWRPTSLTSDIRALIKELPLPVGPEIDPDWGDETLTSQERVYGWNSFAVLAMESGVPEAPVNAISGRAQAAHESGFFPATRSAPDDPWIERVCASLSQTLGVAPHLAPNLGGSLPNHVFMDTLGLPTIWIPHSYGGCNQHAPDEHMLIPMARQALGLMAGLYWDLGKG